MKSIPSLLASALALSVPFAASAQEPLLRLRDALQMNERALAEATKRETPVAVVIVNREGRVIAAARMDGASFLNLEVAQSKAVTAAALGAPTEALESLPEADKLTLLAVPGVVPMTGGIPVTVAGQVVGGVGVSGGSQEQDRAIAQAAAGE